MLNASDLRALLAIRSHKERGELLQFAQQTVKTSPAFVAHCVRTTAPSPNLGEGRGEVKKVAFTLAEVLITLGIIGVVAALTMPVLVANIKDKELETQNKKAQTVLANAFKMFMAKDGVTKLDDTEFASCGNNKDCIAQQFKRVLKIVDEDSESISNIEYQFESEPKKFWENNSNILYNFITPDGMIFGLQEPEDGELINVISDINGLKRPNTGGKDLCLYSISITGKLAENCEAMKDYNPAVCSEETPEACNEDQCYELPYREIPCSRYYWDDDDNKCIHFISSGHCGG